MNRRGLKKCYVILMLLCYLTFSFNGWAEGLSLPDGRYDISIVALKANVHELSMAGQYVNKHTNLDVKSGQLYLNLHFTSAHYMENIDLFVNGEVVAYQVVERNNENNTLSIRFPISSIDNSITFQMNIIPMDHVRVEFRVDINETIEDLLTTVNVESKVETEVKSEEAVGEVSKETAVVVAEETAVVEAEETAVVEAEESAVVEAEETVVVEVEETAVVEAEETVVVEAEETAVVVAEESAVVEAEESAVVVVEETAVVALEEAVVVSSEKAVDEQTEINADEDVVDKADTSHDKTDLIMFAIVAIGALIVVGFIMKRR